MKLRLLEVHKHVYELAVTIVMTFVQRARLVGRGHVYEGVINEHSLELATKLKLLEVHKHV